MQRTPFAGLTVVAPDESIYEDGGSFLANNPRFIDYLLRLGAKTHRHSGLPGLVNPITAPTVAVGAGGFLPSDTTFHVGFTLIDADGGETTVSPIATVTTPGAMPAASAAPGVAVASGVGLPIGTYHYAVTRTDGLGGETTISPKATVSMLAGGTITLTGLNAIRSTDAPTLVIYKSTGGPFFRIAETTGNTFTDDGTPCADCTIEPPTYNTTRTEWLLDIQVPSAAVQGATSVRIYASEETSLISPALLMEVGASALTQQMTRTQYSAGSPPPVSLSKGGANQIDPDTELIDWHWKRPVAASGLLPAGVPGDVRIALTPTGPRVYAVGSASATGPAGWQELVMFGPVGPRGSAGPVGPPGPVLTPKGRYALASAYAQYDSVDHQGSSYWASAATTAGTYPPLAPWTLIAEKGAKGDQGGPGMRWKGEWDITLGYPLDSLITYSEGLWVAAGSAVGAGLRPGSAAVAFRGIEARPMLAFGSGVSDQVLSTQTIPTNFSGAYGNTYGHVFYFDVLTSGTVTIRAAQVAGRTAWDGLAELYSSADSNTPIAQDDQGAGAAMPLITATLAPGRYFYVLRGFTTAQLGYYHVDLSGTAIFDYNVAGYWDRVFQSASGAVAGGGGSALPGHIIASGATTYTQRAKLAFAGSGVTITDDAAGNQTLISFSIPAPTAGSGSLAVVYGATTFPVRGKLKFSGTAVSSVTDDSANDQIVVTLTAGAGGGGGSGGLQWKGVYSAASGYTDRDLVRTASGGAETLWVASGSPSVGAVPGSGANGWERVITAPASAAAGGGGGGGMGLLARSDIATQENLPYPGPATMPTPDTITFTLAQAALVGIMVQVSTTSGGGGNSVTCELKHNGITVYNERGLPMKIRYTNGLETVIGISGPLQDPASPNNNPSQNSYGSNFVNYNYAPNLALTPPNAYEAQGAFYYVFLPAGTHTYRLDFSQDFNVGAAGWARKRRLSAYLFG